MKIVKKNNSVTGLYVLGMLYPHRTGGMEIFNYYFLDYQSKETSNTIYCLGEYKTDNINAHYVPLKSKWPIRFFYPVQFLFAVFKLRKILDYAYISYAEQSWVIPFSQSIILRLFNIPYIITIHWGKEPQWKFKFPFVYYFRHAHAVVGVSELICNAFKKVIPQQGFLYIPPLIPFELSIKPKSVLKEQLGYFNQEKILLFVGSIKPMKNPDKIVEAFRKIGSVFLELHNMRLLFAGSGEMLNELKEKVEKYELSKYIRMEGLVSRENIADYYKAADCYIISSDYEGTSVSLLEAMFNRLPIIASNAPGINGMLTHEKNSLLYDTTNTDQLAETIKRIFLDSLLAGTLAENAFSDFKSKYSYESMMAQYKSVFSSV
jgi:glycosyltransferase involved in cell wall biosynthesis